jgi:uncharacterized membrane protein SirB2
MYMMFKHLHLTALGLSVVMLTLQFIGHTFDMKFKDAKWLKIVPHIVYTILLGSAIGLCIVLNQYPFVDAWVTSKLIGLVLYVLMATLIVKWARNNAMRVVGYIGALTWLLITMQVAFSKTPIF